MAQKAQFFPPGRLMTENAEMTGVEDGTMRRADNVTHRVPGALQARPGFTASEVDTTTGLYPGWLGSVDGDVLVFNTDGASSESCRLWDGSAASAVTVKPFVLKNGDFGRGAELFSSYYMPTQEGVEVVRPGESAFTPAGLGAMVMAGVSASGSVTGTHEWNAVWVAATLSRFEGGRTAEGPPSQIALAGGRFESGNNTLDYLFYFPQDVRVGDSVNIYLSRLSLASVDSLYGSLTNTAIPIVLPPQELFLVDSVPVEAPLSNSISGNIVFNQVTYGRSLYTNASQEGAVSANFPPPLSSSITTFSDGLVFGDAKTSAFITYRAPLPVVTPLDNLGDPAGQARQNTASTADVETLDTSAFNPADFVGWLLTSATEFSADYRPDVDLHRITGYTVGVPDTYQFSGDASITSTYDDVTFVYPIEVSWVDSSGSSSVSSTLVVPYSDTDFTALGITAGLQEDLAGTPISVYVYEDRNRPNQSGQAGANEARGLGLTSNSIRRYTWEWSGEPGVESITVSFRAPIGEVSGVPETQVLAQSMTNSASKLEEWNTFTFTSDSRADGFVAYSKPGQPGAVPVSNFESPGEPGEPVLGMGSARDGLYVFKNSGVYKGTGNLDTGLAFRKVSNVRLLHYSAVTEYNGMLYAWTDQGIGSVSDVGFTHLSRGQIGDLLETRTQALLADRTGVAKPPVLLANPEQHELVCVDNADTAYVYSFKTGMWTRWTDLPDIRAGLYSRALGVVYAGAWGADAGATSPHVYVESGSSLGPEKDDGITEEHDVAQPGDVYQNTDSESFVRDTAATYFSGPTGTKASVNAAPLVTLEYAPLTVGNIPGHKRIRDGFIVLENAKGLLVSKVEARNEGSDTYYTCHEEIDVTPDVTTALPKRRRFWVPREVSWAYRLSVRVTLAGDGGSFIFNGLNLTVTEETDDYSR